MISLTQHINESRHVNKSVVILANHIYSKLKELVEEPAKNPMFDDESRLYELYKKYDDEYDIEINFKDIEGFNWWETQLITYGIPEDPDFDCDMVVRLEKMKTNEFGTMDRGEPMLSINAKHFRTLKTFIKNSSIIRNTIIHELTHYVQYMGNVLKGGTHQKSCSEYDKIFHNELNKRNLKRYVAMSLIIYAFNKNENGARVSGMYGTLQEEFDMLMSRFNRKHRNGTKEDFIEFVIGSKKYNNNELHIQYFGDFLEELEKDTYEDYKKCVDDPNSIYREDSLVYVFLNFCDHCNPKPSFILPNANTCIYNTRTEAEYNKVKNSIIFKFRKNLNTYVKRVKEVIADFYDEMTK